MVEVTGEVEMVEPNFAGILDTDRITNISDNLGDLDVSDDDIADIEDAEPNTNEG